MVKPRYYLPVVHLGDGTGHRPSWRMNNSYKTTSKLSKTKFLALISQLATSICRGSRGLRLRVEGRGGWKNNSAESCERAAHLWTLHQRTQMKGSDGVTSAPAIIREGDAGVIFAVIRCQTRRWHLTLTPRSPF